MCSKIILDSINEYLNFDTTTDTKIIYENPTEFPAVSFCNLNRPTNMYTLSEKLILCVYNRELCNASIFNMYYDSNYGNCYRFNGGLDANNRRIDIFKSRKPGKRNGLRVDLFIGLYNNTDDVSGVHIIIHNRSITPTYNEGVDISPGKLNLLKLIIYS